jgi:integrase/recombinase XerD
MPEAVETKWPVLARHERTVEWLRIWTDMGRAPRTIDAYSRGLTEYLQVCEREGINPLTATRAHVAMFVRELTSRPSRRGANVVALDSGSGLANATLQQRLVPVRLFYDFLGSKKGCGSRILLGGPLYAWPVGWAGERAGAADGEAAVDPE